MGYKKWTLSEESIYNMDYEVTHTGMYWTYSIAGSEIYKVAKNCNPDLTESQHDELLDLYWDSLNDLLYMLGKMRIISHFDSGNDGDPTIWINGRTTSR